MMSRLQGTLACILSLGLIAMVPCNGFSLGNSALQLGHGARSPHISALEQRTALRKAGTSHRSLGVVAALRDGEKSDREMRDEALGFLASESGVSESLEVQLRKAMREADEADARAQKLRASFEKDKAASAPKGNGLSAMLDPMAAAMLQEQSDYVRRCPVTEILESLEETRCGVMQAFGGLQPSTLLGVAAIMYAVSVLQLSP
mmetsp:Transcript_56219/g.132482  ORF Transcript_56219/g.132482 Transcript_56219/m.132482 type:complete len:204 (-) Transcript_56219:322-933(-)